MEMNLNGVKIQALKEIDDAIAFQLKGHDISGFENPFFDKPIETEAGIYSIYQCPHCQASHRVEIDLTAEGLKKNMFGFFSMACSTCITKPKELWHCPNGCEINHALVCGGDFGSKDSSNIYFIMRLDGTYTNKLSEGTLGVPEVCYDHADGGCCLEPICPECMSVCTVEGIRCKDN